MFVYNVTLDSNF